MAVADSRVSRSYDLDDSHKETPMWVLSLATLDRLGNFLNNRKLLKTEDGELRDYRGLEDQAKLSPEERGRVEGSNNKAGEIIKIWSRSLRANVNIGHLWMALTKMERSDVKRELKAQIVKDCMAVRDFHFSKGSEDVQLITRRGDLLTVQDMRTVKRNREAELPPIDALVLYGSEDEAFVEYMVTRMEKIGLRVFFPLRDLKAGMIEHATRSDIINKRCKKVVAVISPSFCSNSQNLYDVDSSTYQYIKNKQRILLPVVYTRQRFDMPASLEGLWKLSYRPERTLVNFWDQLIKSFDDPNLAKKMTDELKKMDFTSPPAETSLPTQANSTSLVTTHTDRMTNASANSTQSTRISDTFTNDMQSRTFDATKSSINSQISTTSSEAALMKAPDPPNHEPGTMQKVAQAIKKKFSKSSKKYKAADS